jgi:hypothetical protein
VAGGAERRDGVQHAAHESLHFTTAWLEVLNAAATDLLQVVALNGVKVSDMQHLGACLE